MFPKEGFIVDSEWIISISKSNNDGLYRYDYNMKTKELKMSKVVEGESDFIPVPSVGIQENSIVDVSNDGMRIEGDCLNNSPFGYVSLINKSNELIYKGVMVGDKKECFGMDFFPGLGVVEYCGCYWNNQRHGYGMLYDRKGELVYEGDWLLGSNDYAKNVILKSIDNEGIVHSLIHELVIDEGCGNDYEGGLLLCGFGYLERFVVKKNSFNKVDYLEISDNCVLKNIEIEDAMWNGAFAHVINVIVFSAIIDN